MQFYVILMLLVFSIFFVGCEVDDTIEDQNNTPLIDSSWFIALDLPTADGNSWEYISSDKQYVYTSRISGTQNMNGATVRVYESNSDFAVDYEGASYGFPVRRYMFTKDINQYKEYAFELWIDSWNDTYSQKYIPERVAWSFPLYKDKEWTVTKQYTEPAYIYTRKVVSGNENVTVPAGNFTQVFLVEESVSIENQQDFGVISSYWLAKGVGIIKYQYVDSSTLSIVSYELNRFSSNKTK